MSPHFLPTGESTILVSLSKEIDIMHTLIVCHHPFISSL